MTKRKDTDKYKRYRKRKKLNETPEQVIARKKYEAERKKDYRNRKKLENASEASSSHQQQITTIFMMSSSRGRCCIHGCSNMVSRKNIMDSEVKFYRFPQSTLNKVWINHKRQLWIDAVKSHVKNPENWEPNKNALICSVHFVNNARSGHPLHPSYLPTIFPGMENTEKSVQAVKRFEQLQQRKSKTKSKSDKCDDTSIVEMEQDDPLEIETERINNTSYIKTEEDIEPGETGSNHHLENTENNIKIEPNDDSFGIETNKNNIISHIKMEQDMDPFEIETKDHLVTSSLHTSIDIKMEPDIDAHEIEIQTSRSVTCQTDETTTTNTMDEPKYFFSSIICRDGVSYAEVQVNSSTLKTCPEDSLQKSVQDVGISLDFTKTHFGGFHGITSIDNDEALSSLTGVNFTIFSFLLRVLPDLKTCKVNKKTRLLITLTKLKTGLTFTALGVLFNIHRTSAQRIFISNLQQLNILLEKYIYWPSKTTVGATLPEPFKKHYPDTRVIIDYIEVNAEVPINVKFMVGSTPNGFISFVSKCYGGRGGVSVATNESDLVNLIESGDVVLADKDFPQIKVEVEKKGAIFIIPPFCQEGTCEDAPVGIDIKQMNQRITDFNIFSKVPESLLPHIDGIAFVVCALLNLDETQL